MNKNYKKTYGISFIINFLILFLSLPIGFLPFVIIISLYKGSFKENISILFKIYPVIIFLLLIFSLFMIIINIIVKSCIKESIFLENDVIKFKVGKKVFKSFDMKDIEKITFYSGTIGKVSPRSHELVFYDGKKTYQIKNAPLLLIYDIKKQYDKKINYISEMSFKWCLLIELIISIIVLIIMFFSN